MIETLISSKTRIKLLLKFFLNSNNSSYLRSLEGEFGESSNGIRLELNRFENAGMLVSFNQGNRKYFQANKNHPLFSEIHSIIMKYVGFDKLIEQIVSNLGFVEKVYVVGEFARGIDSNVVDLIIIGKVNTDYLIKLVEKVEIAIKRQIRYITYECDEQVAWHASIEEPLLLWTKEVVI